MLKEWQFFAVLPKADRVLAVAWWTVLVARGVLPALFAIAMGVLVGAVQTRRLRSAGRWPSSAIAFVLLQVLTPIHQAIGANLGDRTAAWLYDRLTEACVRPPGMGHLEDPALTSDLTVARDFDLGMTGPAAVDLDGLHRRRAGRDDRRRRVRASCSFAFAWWAPLAARRRVAGDALAAARERRLARPQHRRSARARSATPTTRTASPSIRPPAKELRLFGLAAVDASSASSHRRTRLHAAAVRGDAAARAAARVEPAARHRAPTSSCSGRSPTSAVGGSLDLGAAVVVYARAPSARR